MDDEKYMGHCLELARDAFRQGEIPIGAVVVYKDEIIAEGRNEVEHGNCAIKHAEIQAIEKASKIRGWRLDDCHLYVNLEPCIMCTGAIIHSRIKRLCYGLSDPKRGCAGSIENFLQDPRFNHQVIVDRGVLEKESLELIQEFFRKIRTREIPRISKGKGKS